MRMLQLQSRNQVFAVMEILLRLRKNFLILRAQTPVLVHLSASFHLSNLRSDGQECHMHADTCRRPTVASGNQD